MGETQDTNSSYLAAQLPTLGLEVRQVTLVADNLDQFTQVLELAWHRSPFTFTIGGLGGKPTGCACVSRVKRRMCRLVHECFLQDAVCRVQIGLVDVDKQVVVPASEWLSAFVNPHGRHIGSKCGRQSADYLPVLLRLQHSSGGIAELGINLNLEGQAIVKSCVEQVCVDIDPVIHPPVEHRSEGLPGVRHALECGRV
ncbi:MAG: hypothetical protein IID14_07095 [Candidatus Marinimicrobia bacterium]|nr:hypothetical protein [Candidatus Neomarinimicrobiota bacterium]